MTETPAYEHGGVRGRRGREEGALLQEERGIICWRGRNWPFGGPAVNSL